MHMIIVGCGRVGSTLAIELENQGHQVVVVDRNPAAFRRLGEDFTGRTLVGVGFDRDILTDAGITAESAVMAVTSGDNSNIMIARVARELFGVERVVARIYDPRRAAIYERLGIATVATVAWTSNRILRTILPHDGATDWTDPTSTYQLVERRITGALAGKSVSSTPAHVALINRHGKADIPKSDTLFQEADVVHLLATSEQISSFDAHLAGHEGAHS
ncbi:MAG: TrkA family potassium uptake protein [Actinobacteria bacterium]|jgi:trk system potassium uptake protein TrkA|nr:TrkA family potassium uptake protein [Actinomycetota bacterium]